MDGAVGERMNLSGWLPARIAWRDSAPQVEWILMGNERLLEPFFEQTLQRQMMNPFHQLFRRETSMEEMCLWTEAHPRSHSKSHSGAPLKGIVYHMSRCGSTLIGRQLAAIERTIVASEPEPMDDVLSLPLHIPDLPRAVHIHWLRAMAAALGQARNGEQAFYLKTDCWHIHDFDLLREAFPETPWIFLYRDPVEVMVSQTRMPAAWTVPSQLDPVRLGLQRADWNPPYLDVYRARALANICAAGLRAAQHSNGGLLVNYCELPEAMYDRLLAHFGLRADDVVAMRNAAQRNAKSPTMTFVPDQSAKQAEASDRLRAVVAEQLLPVYEQLEAVRLKQLDLGTAVLGQK